MKEDNLGWFGHTWNFVVVVVFIVSALVAYLQYSESNIPDLAHLGPLCIAIFTGAQTTYQVLKRRPDRLLLKIFHRQNVHFKMNKDATKWLNKQSSQRDAILGDKIEAASNKSDRNLYETQNIVISESEKIGLIIEEEAQKQISEIKVDAQTKHDENLAKSASMGKEISELQTLVSEGFNGNKALLEQLISVLEKHPENLGIMIDKVVHEALDNEYKSRAPEREQYISLVTTNQKAQSSSRTELTKEALRDEIILALVQFRDHFARTKEKEHIEDLNKYRLKILSIAQQAEVYLNDDLQDINQIIWSAFLELTIAIDRFNSKVLAPTKRKEQWEDRIYGNRNIELYKQVADCVETVKQRFQPKPSDELSNTDMKILRTLWQYLKYEKIHGLLQAYGDNRVHIDLIENIDTYREYRRHPKYDLTDIELEAKLKEFDSALFKTFDQGTDIFGPTITHSDYVIWDGFEVVLTQKDFSARQTRYEKFVTDMVVPTRQVYQEFIDILKRRQIFQLLEWSDD